MAIEHHLQKDILQKLVLSENVRYADIKPAAVDGNIFTYHLHQLEKQNYVQKQADGSYSLTATGKALGISSALSAQELLEQAHPVFFLAVRDSSGQWLLRKRLVQPVYGKWGFIHGEPQAAEPISVTAARVFMTKTGLSAAFEACGSGYIRIFQAEELESFTQFTLLCATIEHQVIITHDSTGENAWLEQPDFASNDMIPSMAELASQLQNNDEFFFCELNYKL